MIDLHTHTNESDGSCTPLELVDRALAIGLEALAISDHDTFGGYDQAREPARAYGLDLVCGIELSVRMSRNERRNFAVG
jgi:predicted metal-dependent phosphoesterase TrpH